MTHDTWNNMLKELGASLEKVLIHRLVNGVFYASIYLRNEQGTQLVFDSRPSDAIALAVRLESPIYALESILEQGGITDKEEKKADAESALVEEEVPIGADNLNLEDLEDQLAEAVLNEDYELAAKLRDHIEKLKS